MKDTYLKYIPFLILIVIATLSIAYSAFKYELLIENTVADVRIQKEVRVTSFSLKQTNNAISTYEEYNHNALITNVNMPTQDSTVTYKVEVTNFGNVEMGIYELINLPDNLEYELQEYELGSKICNSNNECTLGATKEFLLTIKYKQNGYNARKTTYNLNLKVSFKKMHTITYDGIKNDGSYPTEAIENGTISITFPASINKIQVFESDIRLTKDIDYTYLNNELIIKNITGNIKIEYKEKAYLTQLSEGLYFKETDYINNITTISFVDYIDTSNAIKTYNLEENNGTNIIGWLEENKTGYDLYIGSYWDIYSKNMITAFKDMTNVTNIAFDNINTSECTSFYGAFYNLSSVTSINLENIDTSNTKNMQNMFNGMTSLKQIDLSKFNTDKATNMRGMFNSLTSLTSLDLSNFNTENVTNMSYMFYGLNLETLDITHFDTSKVTTTNHMFTDMKYIKTIDLSNFKTDNVEDMTNMFSGMNALTSLDIKHFNTSKVKNMTYLFFNLHSITRLELANFDTSNVEAVKGMFANCYELVYVDISNASFDAVTDFTNMFRNLSSEIEIIVADENVKTLVEGLLSNGGTVTIKK